MAEEFQAGICSGNWWNQGRSNGYDGSNTTSVSCSAGIGGGEAALSWTADGKARSCDEPSGSASGSSITLGPLTDSSTMQIPGFGFSPSIMDWTQPLLTSSSGRAETSFHAMLQDDLSSRPFFHHDPSIDTDRVRSVSEQSDNPFKIMNNFLVDQHHLSSGDEPSGSGINMFDPDMNHQQSIYDNRLVDYQSPAMGYRGSHNELSQPSWPKFSQLLKASPPNNESPNQLQFLNNTPFWNASATAQIMTHTFDQKSNCSKSNSGGARDSSSISSMAKKSNGSEPASKKPRMETPSPLPTFKVRKEKLGDRITALQQLVSPFGKTDTASVLHEAIEYIKFLHEQVNVLSTPYLKNGHPMQHQQNPEKSRDDEGSKQDLRSRGLCLVPVSSTYPVASETQMDFWNPTFGGTYR